MTHRIKGRDTHTPELLKEDHLSFFVFIVNVEVSNPVRSVTAKDKRKREPSGRDPFGRGYSGIPLRIRHSLTPDDGCEAFFDSEGRSLASHSYLQTSGLVVEVIWDSVLSDRFGEGLKTRHLINSII